MIYVAIDLSIKSPGIAIHYTRGGKPFNILFSFTEHNIPTIADVGTFNEDEYKLIIIRNSNTSFKLADKTWDLKKDYFKRITSNANLLIELINNILMNIVIPYADDNANILFAIEGYSYGGKGRTHDIAEMGGILKYLIETQYRTTVQVVEPTTIKMFALKGNASKEELTEEIMKQNESIKNIYESLKVDFTKKRSNKNPLYESPFNDITDAYFLLKYIIANHK